MRSGDFLNRTAGPPITSSQRHFSILPAPCADADRFASVLFECLHRVVYKHRWRQGWRMPFHANVLVHGEWWTVWCALIYQLGDLVTTMPAGMEMGIWGSRGSESERLGYPGCVLWHLMCTFWREVLAFKLSLGSATFWLCEICGELKRGDKMRQDSLYNRRLLSRDAVHCTSRR